MINTDIPPAAAPAIPPTTRTADKVEGGLGGASNQEQDPRSTASTLDADKSSITPT